MGEPEDIPSRTLAMFVFRAFRSAVRAASGLVFPSLCLGCGGPLADAAPICASCVRTLPRPAPEALAGQLLARDCAEPLARRSVALWRFDPGGTVQRVQHALKYGRRPSLGIPLGRLLGDATQRHARGWAPDVVCPVPLAPIRELERGYNQSAGLASGAADALACETEDLLVRTRSTRTQTTLAFSERWQNVAGAFARSPEARPLAGVRVLLVDDVVTTGATLLAAAQPLLDAGAEVTVAALAMADG